MNKVLYVQPRWLLALAALVWLAAGINIAHIGLEAYVLELPSIPHDLESLAVGLVFWFCIFMPLVKKHTARIRTYTESQLFIHFFDLKSFIIMAIMMTAGISIRTLHLAPNVFIAVFYTGLGCALTLAGLLFALNCVRWSYPLNPPAQTSECN